MDREGVGKGTGEQVESRENPDLKKQGLEASAPAPSQIFCPEEQSEFQDPEALLTLET